MRRRANLSFQKLYVWSPRYQLVLIVSDYTVFLFDKNKNISFVNVQFKNNFFALSAGFGQTLPSFLSINKLSQ